MNEKSNYRILVVDDEKSVRDSISLLLTLIGRYQVSTADDGFDALLQMKSTIPDIIISDLNMPNMSGFEFLSVVRRRFPEVPVIAASGAYQSGDEVPGGVIADRFHPKGHHPQELLEMVAELIRTSAEKAIIHTRKSAPVWIPRNGKDSNGVPFIVLTCTECLRSFPISVLREDVQEIQETPCHFCSNPVRYVIDFSVAVYSPKRESTGETSEGAKSAKRA